MQTRVLVVSASMGAGHDGAARELVRRLIAEGCEAEMRDFLDSPPLHIGALLRSSYEFQMKYMAWSYDLTYRLLYRAPALCPPIGRLMTRLTGPRLVAWAGDYRADVVVSTYPLTSVVLGELRRAQRIQVPTINFITDFGVHPFWTHRGIDLNLAVHPRAATSAEAKSGRPTIATGPMVSPRFGQPQDRAATRTALGLSPGDRAVLIVSGSWGVGDVAKTFRTIANSEYVPIAVCGRDERLRSRLDRIPGGRSLGWRDDMPSLMAASDALVENAGGLTAMEALSVGLPVISYRPIAGHGKENTAEMARAGVNRVARTPVQLLQCLDLVTTMGPARRAMVEAGRAMFAGDPARYVEHAALVGAEGLNDRDLLAGVAAGRGSFDPDQLSGMADGVDFDPAEELRALLAGGPVALDAPDAPVPDVPGSLAPVVPIGTGKGGRTPAGVDAGIAEGGVVDAGVADADVVAMRPRVTVGAARAPGESDDLDDLDDDLDEIEPTGTDGDTGRPRAGRPPARRPRGPGAGGSGHGPGRRQQEGSSGRLRRPSVAVTRVAALVAAVPLIWAALTSGVAFATSYGAGVAHPRSDSGQVAYIGVRLAESQLTSPAIADQLEALHASAVVDEQTATGDPADVQRLVTLGVDVENGGAGQRVNSDGHHIDQSPWKRANGDVAASHYLAQIAGEPVTLFVPGRRVNAFDLMACYGAHNKTVVPDRILDPNDDDPLTTVTPRHTYLVNGTGATNAQLQAMLSLLATRLAAAHLSGAPLADLV